MSIRARLDRLEERYAPQSGPPSPHLLVRFVEPDGSTVRVLDSRTGEYLLRESWPDTVADAKAYVGIDPDAV